MESAIRILLIDDDDQLRLLLDHVLRGAGYTVDAVARAAEARARLAEHTYNLVIADARLPDGNGVEIADEARAMGMTAVILTGYERQVPHHEYLFKPIRPDELERAVEQYVRPAKI
jgi:DNA-binding response OmpR family regulator